MDARWGNAEHCLAGTSKCNGSKGRGQAQRSGRSNHSYKAAQPRQSATRRTDTPPRQNSSRSTPATTPNPRPTGGYVTRLNIPERPPAVALQNSSRSTPAITPNPRPTASGYVTRLNIRERPPAGANCCCWWRGARRPSGPGSGSPTAVVVSAVCWLRHMCGTVFGEQPGWAWLRHEPSNLNSNLNSTQLVNPKPGRPLTVDLVPIVDAAVARRHLHPGVRLLRANGCRQAGLCECISGADGLAR